MAETKPTSPLRISPFCSRLRSKKLCFRDTPPRTVEDILDASGRAWCQHTMGAIGPDGEIVDPEDCGSRRSCFEPFGPKGGPHPGPRP